MAAPLVIRWTDSGAPALTKMASTIIAVFDYCLPQKGWLKEFSGVDKAVYRAGSGQRKYYRVLHDDSFYAQSSSYTWGHAKISGYDTMTSVDDGAGLWGEGYVYVSAQPNDGQTPRPWICILDETGFVFITYPGATTATVNDYAAATHYIGETVPSLPGEPARNIIAAKYVLDLYGTALNGVENENDNNAVACNRSLDGTRSRIKTFLKRNGGQEGCRQGYQEPVGNIVSCIYDYPYNGNVLYARPMLNDGVALSLGDYIPGLYHPSQKYTGFTNLQTYTDGEKTFLAIIVFAAVGRWLQNALYRDAGQLADTFAGVVFFDISTGFRV